MSSRVAKRSRVLVADDDPLIVHLVTAVLEDAQFDIDVAHDGETAVAIALEKQPDVVILDLMMPGLDGYEVCRRLRADERTSSARIVMLTAKIADTVREEALNAGCDVFFTKPFSPLQLIEVVTARHTGAA